MLVQDTDGNDCGLWQNWPSPTCSDVYTGNLKSTQQKPGSMHSVTLPQAVAMWPTPTAHLAKETGAESEYNRNEPSIASRLFDSPDDRNGMVLNPDWTELLMGWVKGWSSLAPLSKENMDAFIKANNGKALQDVRCNDGQETVRETVGGCECIPPPKSLQYKLCEHESGSKETCLTIESKEVSEQGMRSLSVECEACHSSLRPESIQQRSNEPANALQEMPRQTPFYGKASWLNGSWEIGTPRAIKPKPNYKNRLKAIGNGQVPLCVVKAWELLA